MIDPLPEQSCPDPCPDPQHFTRHLVEVMDWARALHGLAPSATPRATARITAVDPA